MGFRHFLAGLAALAASACASAPSETAAATAFRRGVNIIGYDPIWEDASKARFQERHFGEIKRGGFDFVRVNLMAFRHMDAQNRLDPKWLERLDWVVREATEAGLGVILD